MMDIRSPPFIGNSLPPFTISSLFFLIFLIFHLFRRTFLPTLPALTGFTHTTLPALFLLFSFFVHSLHYSFALHPSASLPLFSSPPPSLCSPPLCSDVPDFVILSFFLPSLQFVIHFWPGTGLWVPC